MAASEWNPACYMLYMVEGRHSSLEFIFEILKRKIFEIFLKILLFVFMCVCCIGVENMACVCPWRPKQVVGFCGAGGAGG